MRFALTHTGVQSIRAGTVGGKPLRPKLYAGANLRQAVTGRGRHGIDGQCGGRNPLAQYRGQLPGADQAFSRKGGDAANAQALQRQTGHHAGVVGAPMTVGKVLKKPMTEITEAEYDEMSAINSKSAFFFLKEAGKHVNDGGKVCTIVTSLLGAFTPFYASYAGTKAPVEHFTRAAAKEFGARGISVTAVGPGPMDTPFFYPAEGADAVAYHKTAAALSPFSSTGLTDIEDVVPFIRHLVSDGWWITGQTILINGGYTTK